MRGSLADFSLDLWVYSDETKPNSIPNVDMRSVGLVGAGSLHSAQPGGWSRDGAKNCAYAVGHDRQRDSQRHAVPQPKRDEHPISDPVPHHYTNANPHAEPDGHSRHAHDALPRQRHHH